MPLASLLWLLVLVLVIFWVLGQTVVVIGTPLIHLLIVIAIIVAIYNLMTRNRVV